MNLRHQLGHKQNQNSGEGPMPTTQPKPWYQEPETVTIVETTLSFSLAEGQVQGHPQSETGRIAILLKKRNSDVVTGWSLAAAVIAYGIVATALMTTACAAVPPLHGYHYVRHVEQMMRVMAGIAVVMPPFVAVGLGLMSHRIRVGAITGATVGTTAILAVLLGNFLGGDPMLIRTYDLPYDLLSLARSTTVKQYVVPIIGINAFLGATGALARQMVSIALAAKRGSRLTGSVSTGR